MAYVICRQAGSFCRGGEENEENERKNIITDMFLISMSLIRLAIEIESTWAVGWSFGHHRATRVRTQIIKALFLALDDGPCQPSTDIFIIGALAMPDRVK